MLGIIPSGVLVAVVLMPATSLPAKASVIARQIFFSPEKTSLAIFAFHDSSLANCKTADREIVILEVC